MSELENIKKILELLIDHNFRVLEKSVKHSVVVDTEYLNTQTIAFETVIEIINNRLENLKGE
jgi:hypothetical protein